MPRLTLRERIFGHTEERALSPNTVTPPLSGGLMLSDPTPTGTLAIADAYACIRAIVDAISSLPIHSYRRTDEGRVRIDGRGAELLRRPSPGATTPNFIGTVALHLQTHGNAYVAKLRRGSEIVQLWPIHPEQVTVKIENGEPRYEVVWGGRRHVVGTEDIIHVRGMSFDGVTGLSPIRQARTALKLADGLSKWGIDTLENAAVPKGVLRVDQYGDADAVKEALRSAWEEDHAQPGKLAVVSGVASYEPVSVPLTDLQFLEQRKLSSTEIARIFRVPPWVIGADSGSSMTYSNVEQQGLHFVTYSLRPHLVTIESALSADTDLFPGNAYCQFAIDALLRSDANARSQFYARALDPVTGWLTRSEVRDLEDAPPEGDRDPGDSTRVEQMIAAAANGAEVEA